MSNLINHAKTEFRAAGWTDEHGNFKDDMQEIICNGVLELLEVFSKEGHSGTTAPYAIELFSKLAKFEPVVPLTGEDWEWNEVAEGLYQNKRCSHVFKNKETGEAYDIDGKVFYEWGTRELEPDEEGYPGEYGFKSYFTNGDSKVPVTFPYTPTTEYVERIEDDPEEV